MPRGDAKVWDEPEDEDDAWDDDDSATVACPNCGRQVYEDAEQCPHCGEYIIPGASGGGLSGQAGWYQVLVVLGIVAVIIACLVIY
jgi:hypothetical protein